jgi:hypothetical protein
MFCVGNKNNIQQQRQEAALPDKDKQFNTAAWCSSLNILLCSSIVAAWTLTNSTLKQSNLVGALTLNISQTRNIASMQVLIPKGD